MCVYISTYIIQNLHVCACSFACMHTDLTCICVHIDLYAHRFNICDVYAHRVYMCVCIYLRKHAQVYMCVYVVTYIFAYTRTSLHVCVCSYVYAHSLHVSV